MNPAENSFHSPNIHKDYDFITHRENPLLTHRRSSALAGINLGVLGLRDTLGEDSSILAGSILGTLSVTTLECESMTLVLETLRGDQTLDLWCLGVDLLALTLWLNLTTDNEFTDIILLGEPKELSNLGGTLGAQSLWVDNVGDTWDVALSLLDNAQSENGQIHGDDASTDGFTLALTSAAWAVARVTLGKEKSDTGWVHNTLLHWETLLVVTTGNLEDVSLELVSDGVSWNLSAHSLVHEDTELALVFDIDELLTAIGRE